MNVSEVAGCNGCPLQRLFPNNPFVPPKSGTGLRLAIAEAPGLEESERLEPLVGGSGRKQDAMYRAAGVSRSELTISNTLCCRPPENVYPTDTAARSYISLADAQHAQRHCYKNHLEPLLKSRPWKRIDILGDKALRVLTEGQVSSITEERGSPVNIPACDNRLIGMPTLHPAYLIRNQRLTKVVIGDLGKTLTLAPEYYVPFPSLEVVKAFTATTFSFDIENDPRTSEVFMVGLTANRYRAICVPFKGAYINELKRIFAGAKAVIGQNSLQHDEPIMRLHGVHIPPTATHYDIMLMCHLLMPEVEEYNLEFLASIFVNKQNWKRRRNESEEIYNCRDTDVQFQIWEQVLPLLRKEKTLDLYLNVQVPLARICYLMRQEGIKVDPNRIYEVRDKFKAEMQQLEAALPKVLQTYQAPIKKRELAPAGTLSPKTRKPIKYVMVDSTEEITPWRSSDILKEYFYGTKQLPPQTHPKTKEVTIDKTALEKLERKVKTQDFRAKRGDESAELSTTLATLRKIKKLSTLLSNFITEKVAAAEFQHTHFNPNGTSTGRLSSSDPNLQNIPETARYLYVPRHSDWELLEVDYSSIENRLSAWLANDDDRSRRQSQPGFNEHKYAASKFFHLDIADIEKDNDKDAPYGKAKRIVHGVDKGMGPKMLCNMYDMELREVTQLMNTWKTEIHKTIEWQQRVAADARSSGVCVTGFGRKLYTYTDRYYTESIAFASQSPAADIIFRAMIGLMYERINLYPEMARLVVPVIEALPQPCKLLLQVHDSLLFELPREMRDRVLLILKRVMEQPWKELGGFYCPIAAKVGPSWGEMKPLEV